MRGWEKSGFAKVAGRSIEFMRPQFFPLFDAGLLEETPEAIRATTRGLLFWDDIGTELL